MKKTVCLMLSLLLLLLCACSGESAAQADNAATTLPTQAEFIVPTIPDEPLIVEPAFTYTRAINKTEASAIAVTEHSVRCPKVTVQTEGTDAFNKKLEEAYRAAETLLKQNKEGEDIYLYDYLFTQFEGVIGLVTDHTLATHSGALLPTYEPYYFDTNTGKELTAQEYQAMMDISAEEVLEEAVTYGYLDIAKEWALEWFVADYEVAIIMVRDTNSSNDLFLTTVEYPQFLARRQAQENQE